MGLFGRQPTARQRELAVRQYMRAPDSAPLYFRAHDWDQLLDLLQPGDNLLTINPGTGTTFRAAYGRPFTHLAVVYDRGHIVEALHKVVVSPIDKYQLASFAVTRWQGITPEQQAYIAEGARGMVGMEYDVPQLVWLFGRGLLKVGADGLTILDLLTARKLSSTVAGMRLIAGLMNRRNLLDSKAKVICSAVAARLARSANKHAMLPALPVGQLPGPGAEAPASFAILQAFDWVAIHTRKDKPVK